MQTNRGLDNIKDVPIFFILGSPRSGTTLLRFLLDSHENIYIPLESPYIISLFRKYRNISEWNEITFEKLFRDLSFFQKYKLWKADKNKLKNDILLYGKNATYQIICKIIHTNYFSLIPKKEVKLIGDKNTPYGLRNKAIHGIFPDAKFIHFVRDYRAHLFSMLNTGIYSKIVPSIVTRWKYQNNKIEKLKVKVPGNFITIRYEDLVDNAEITIKKICIFLNIEYKSQMVLHPQRNDISNFFNKNEFEKLHNSLT